MQVISEQKNQVVSIFRHWRSDFLAAIMVMLVALPLSLGVATASGAPPVSGLIAAICGGMVTGLYRGGYLSVYGPGAGMIVVIMAVIMAAGPGSAGFSKALAVFVVSGAIQVVLGWLRMGKLGDIFPAGVVNGMLAGIGLIILIKQSHVALGVSHQAPTVFGSLLALQESIMQLNPAIVLLSATSLLVLVIVPKLGFTILRKIPVQMWVLVVVAPLVYWMDFFSASTYIFLGNSYPLNPSFLVSLPENVLGGFVFPDFSWMDEPVFWLMVLSITLVGAIETLVVAKAVDKLDPMQRETALNKELIGVGLGTMVSGFIGGLPLIPVIARSAVNIKSGAKTRLSNFFQGFILLVILLFLGEVIRAIPLAILAALLIFTGYSLASPQVIRRNFSHGKEQAISFVLTIVVTLVWGLFEGIIVGIFASLLINLLVSPSGFFHFLRTVFRPVVTAKKGENDMFFYLESPVHFLNILGLANRLPTPGNSKKIHIDVSRAPLIDGTAMEYLYKQVKKHEKAGGSLEVVGIERLKRKSAHPFSLHLAPRQ